MGKLGRFACIFTPMALSIASLLCLLLVFLGGLNKNDSNLSSLWFFRADASDFLANPDFDLISGTDIDDHILQAFRTSASSNKLKDFYTVHLWNYCSGDIKGDDFKLTYCSPRQASFWFNPEEVWGLNNTAAERFFPKQLDKGLDVYRKVSKWMFAAYSIAFWVTVAEIVLGIFAIFSRWGSFVTTIASTASTIMTLAASATSTALYGSLTGAFNTVLKPYHIKGELGHKMMVVTWLAVAFSFGAGLFWLISTCCCSGKSDKKRVKVEKTPYTYERVASPYLGHREQHGGSHEMHNMGPQQTGKVSAYEPFRHT
ncbi:hypothetical protein M501DRAFT_1009727 [Patellaria atrata CBS 101060]|uniref:Integral membrane protein n=1 Tax=Patellaria atrata CBS 101060 TaxID=1346257 RepID=A0A9P4S2A6_9PEZI|nr:hypothetical protein M501DRAFT_1009727 [Patellaria atrata CBS 101060]